MTVYDLLHILSNNKKRKSNTTGTAYCKDGKCFLCEVLGLDATKHETMSSKMGCFQCGQCFHLQCFNLVHQQHLNTTEFNNMMDEAISALPLRKKRRKI
jgi:heterodisulfide reductase subunit A-like polyferredoxin